ncbi:MAG TPA: hypothetical protein VGM95_04410 [Lactobacillaceae bacterium]|jgi:hypothetical protein
MIKRISVILLIAGLLIVAPSKITADLLGYTMSTPPNFIFSGKYYFDDNHQLQIKYGNGVTDQDSITVSAPTLDLDAVVSSDIYVTAQAAAFPDGVSVDLLWSDGSQNQITNQTTKIMTIPAGLLGLGAQTTSTISTATLIYPNVATIENMTNQSYVVNYDLTITEPNPD